jgi:hypothetical protein
MAFSIDSKNLKSGLIDVFRGNNTLDCSLAKQLSYLNGFAHCQDEQSVSSKGASYAVYNESIKINETTHTTADDFTEEVTVSANMEKGNTLIPGDAVYFENHEDYPTGPEFLFAGQHAIYMGKNEDSGDLMFTGFGVPPASEDAILEKLQEAYESAKQNGSEMGEYPRLSNTVTRFKLS